MSEQVSIIGMLKHIKEQLQPADLNDWETTFVTSILRQIGTSQDTTILSPKQVECIQKIWKKNFARRVGGPPIPMEPK